MVAGLIVVPVVSVLTPKLKKDRVDEIFAAMMKRLRSPRNVRWNRISGNNLKNQIY